MDRLTHSEFYIVLCVIGTLLTVVTGIVTVGGWFRRKKSDEASQHGTQTAYETAETLRSALSRANTILNTAKADYQRADVVNRAIISREFEIAIEAATTMIVAKRRDESYAHIVEAALSNRQYLIANQAANNIQNPKLRDNCQTIISKTHLQGVKH